MNVVNTKTHLQKIFLPVILFSLFSVFFWSASTRTVSAAELCVTNPEWGLCPLSVILTPTSSFVPLGGNTDIGVREGGILQYDVEVMDLEVWMTDNVTGITTQLFWPGTFPNYGATRIVNTGPLTNPVTISAWAMNTQGIEATAITQITIAGTLNVSANTPGASYTITGPATLTGSGSSTTFANQPPGVYTITWNAVSGYTTPASSSQTLPSKGTINFSGDYVSTTPPTIDVHF